MPLLVFRDAPTGFPDAPTGFPAKNRPLSVGEAPCLQKKNESTILARCCAVVCVQQSACAGAELSVHNCVC